MKRKLYNLRLSLGLYEEQKDNIYHCSIQKGASSWFATLFNDPIMLKLTNRPFYRPGKDFIGEYKDKLDLLSDLPKGHIISPIYIRYDDFLKIPKTKKYKAFYVMRDPRDFVISQYFSIKYTHGSSEEVLKQRELLESMSEEDGIMNRIPFLIDSYRAMQSWTKSTDENVLVCKFEDLFGANQSTHLKKLFDHLDIKPNEKQFNYIIEKYSFKNIAGRKKGDGDKHSHYRKGVAGDWKNYFTDMHKTKFKELAGDILVDLGYEKDLNW